MNIGTAIKAAINGQIVTRSKWQGNIDITVAPGRFNPQHVASQLDAVEERYSLEASLTEINGFSSSLFQPDTNLGEFVTNPFLMFVNNKKKTSGVYTPSQEDLLSNDWHVVNEGADDQLLREAIAKSKFN